MRKTKIYSTSKALVKSKGHKNALQFNWLYHDNVDWID